MNRETLKELIDRYEAKLPVLYDAEHDELFKWNALKTFQEEWFAPAEKYPDFLSRFTAATRDFSVLIDNSVMHPRNGVVKLYEKEPREVARLFTEVLFAQDGGELALRQANLEAFIEGMEKLREEYYPGNWSYKQDRHAATTYLAMYAPAENYVYKFGEAEAMAVAGEFGLNIGSGADFNLAHYYKMCGEVVEALKEHPTILNTHTAYLQDKHYRDESLHLLAFDLLYCCKNYHLYTGITFRPKKEAIRRAAQEAKRLAEEAEVQERRQQAIDTLLSQLEELELGVPDITGISLVNVEVSAKGYGAGVVTEQSASRITVRFTETEKTYILDKQFFARPRFENDTEVVPIFTEYNRLQKEIDRVKRQLEDLGVQL